ncbi:hypothetical protein [Actinomadura xylanilytica]|uniref:hypothetical protein n=1 Tax=Actinomadura xylanilytica TaxID=887459 RepID=UPI00255AC777|nr:hypothetical protein [Actinomadura xylanilytica]MDL4773018.1 hypothetical protein [Actinomadura xylanilytica]
MITSYRSPPTKERHEEKNHCGLLLAAVLAAGGAAVPWEAVQVARAAPAGGGPAALPAGSTGR